MLLHNLVSYKILLYYTKYKVFHDYEWVVKVLIDNETGEYDFITFDESELFEAILYYQLVQE